MENTSMVWEDTFTDYDDKLLLDMFSSEWHQVELNGANSVLDKINGLLTEFISKTNLKIPEREVRNIIENTPPIFQIKNLFSTDTVEREISAYDALHLRFDGLAFLAESLIERYGKQGELIVYDLMVESRLASDQGKRGRIDQFITNFTAQPDKPDIFTAGLEIEHLFETKNEVKVNVLECEWARYFRERHPEVGYLMACSTDEIAYKTYNKRLRLQRTKTIMEGAEICDFWIYAIGDHKEE
jgi:hypothetical protein